MDDALQTGKSAQTREYIYEEDSDSDGNVGQKKIKQIGITEKIKPFLTTGMPFLDFLVGLLSLSTDGGGDFRGHVIGLRGRYGAA